MAQTIEPVPPQKDIEAPTLEPHSNSKASGLSAVSVTFKDLTYTVKTKKKEELRILDGLGGYFEVGSLAALMGPSGSGKTTLLDVLAGRKNVGVTEGEVLYGGVAASAQVLKNVCGYVEQFDTLVGELTVKQMLRYTAELKLPASASS